MISACDATCDQHPHVTIIHFCAACRRSTSSPKIAEAAKVNGKKGGRPRKTEPKAKP